MTVTARDATKKHLSHFNASLWKLKVDININITSSTSIIKHLPLYMQSHLPLHRTSRVTRCVGEKVAQTLAQSIFCDKQYIMILPLKGSLIVCATSVIFTKSTHSKQAPTRRKFAHSGHPAYELLCILVLTWIWQSSADSLLTSGIDLTIKMAQEEQTNNISTKNYRFHAFLTKSKMSNEIMSKLSGWCQICTVDKFGIFRYFVVQHFRRAKLHFKGK
jgi:hypothetical protein